MIPAEVADNADTFALGARRQTTLHRSVMVPWAVDLPDLFVTASRSEIRCWSTSPRWAGIGRSHRREVGSPSYATNRQFFFSSPGTAAAQTPRCT